MFMYYSVNATCWLSKCTDLNYVVKFEFLSFLNFIIFMCFFFHRLDACGYKIVKLNYLLILLLKHYQEHYYLKKDNIWKIKNVSLEKSKSNKSLEAMMSMWFLMKEYIVDIEIRKTRWVMQHWQNAYVGIMQCRA